MVFLKIEGEGEENDKSYLIDLLTDVAGKKGFYRGFDKCFLASSQGKEYTAVATTSKLFIETCSYE